MKDKKIWFMLSGVSIILGIIILAAGRFMGGSPGFYIDREGVHTSGNIKTVDAVEGTKELEAFDSIELDIDYADVEIVVSDRFAVDYCIMGDYENPICEVKDGTFIFKDNKHSRLWNFGIFTSSFGVAWEESDYCVKIEIPREHRFGSVSINMEDGNLALPGMHADSLTISNEYGNINMKEYKGNRLSVDMEDGNFSADFIEASGAEIRNAYGDIMIGDASGEKLSADMEDGVFRVNHLDIEKIEVDNEYGDVHLGIKGDIYQYGYELDTEYGYISIADGKWKKNYSEDGMRYESEGSGAGKIKVSCEDGDIEIYQSK